MSIEENENPAVAQEGYPEAVEFSDQYSFFCMAVKHKVNRDTVNQASPAITDALFAAGWDVHPSLKGVGKTKKFSIFTPQVDSSFYGNTNFVSKDSSDEEARKKALHDFMVKRLDSKIGEKGADGKGASETVFLRKMVDKKYSFIDAKTGEAYEIQLHWLDLWLFTDDTGILSFKAELLGKRDISRLAIFHRSLRDTMWDIKLSDEIQGEPQALWKNIVLLDALGNGACLGIGNTENLFDPYQKSAKVLMAGQLKNPLSDKHAMDWGRPLIDLPILLHSEHKQRLQEGRWDATLNAARASVVAGYATVRDMLLFELATVSTEGASLGWNGRRGFQYSAEYVRQMIDGQFVEVWEHWNALMLRDSCVMLSFDPSMPLVTQKRGEEIVTGQAEERYYPLYILTYHLRYSLDRISDELIDSNLSDAMKSRELRENFIRFRNQYWFHEVTTDFLGREVYEKMKLGIGVDDAYEAVQDEVDTVNAYIREKWASYTAGIVATWGVVSTVSSLPYGWWYILSVAVLVIGMMVAISKEVPIAIQWRNWGVNKFKNLYKRFLDLDFMRGC